MALLLNELKEKICLYCDGCLLCELLDLEPEDILERFEDRLVENIDPFYEMCEEDNNDY